MQSKFSHFSHHQFFRRGKLVKWETKMQSVRVSHHGFTWYYKNQSHRLTFIGFSSSSSNLQLLKFTSNCAISIGFCSSTWVWCEFRTCLVDLYLLFLLVFDLWVWWFCNGNLGTGFWFSCVGLVGGALMVWDLWNGGFAVFGQVQFEGRFGFEVDLGFSLCSRLFVE